MDPVWNFDCRIEPQSMDDDIQLIVMDDNIGTDDIIGSAKVEMRHLCLRPFQECHIDIKFNG